MYAIYAAIWSAASPGSLPPSWWKEFFSQAGGKVLRRWIALNIIQYHGLLLNMKYFSIILNCNNLYLVATWKPNTHCLTVYHYMIHVTISTTKRVNTCWLPNLNWWRNPVSKMKSCNRSCSQRACTAFGSGMKSCNGSCSQRECTAYRYLCSADFDCQAFFFEKHVCLTCMCLLDFDWFLWALQIDWCLCLAKSYLFSGLTTAEVERTKTSKQRPIVVEIHQSTYVLLKMHLPPKKRFKKGIVLGWPPACPCSAFSSKGVGPFLGSIL